MQLGDRFGCTHPFFLIAFILVKLYVYTPPRRSNVMSVNGVQRYTSRVTNELCLILLQTIGVAGNALSLVVGVDPPCSCSVQSKLLGYKIGTCSW